MWVCGRERGKLNFPWTNGDYSYLSCEAFESALQMVLPFSSALPLPTAGAAQLWSVREQENLALCSPEAACIPFCIPNSLCSPCQLGLPLPTVGVVDATSRDTWESGSNWVSIAKALNQGPEAAFCKPSQTKPWFFLLHSTALLLLHCFVSSLNRVDSEQLSTRQQDYTPQNNLHNLW